MTYKVWPIEFNYKWQRTELDDLARLGYSWTDPYNIIDIFERKVAEYAGSKFAVAVDSCSHGLFLSLKYLKATGTITIPNRTYVSVPMQIIHAGCKVNFSDIEWSGIYQLAPYPVWDGAVRWTQGMYQGGFHVLSFQIKKRIPVGRGGMILTDDIEAYTWLKRACYDGRNVQIPHNLDTVESLGWHYYMTPEDAARGIILMDQTALTNPDSATQDSYAPLDHLKVFK